MGLDHLEMNLFSQTLESSSKRFLMNSQRLSVATVE